MKALARIALFLALVCSAGSARAESPGRVILDAVVEKTGERIFVGKVVSEQLCLAVALKLTAQFPRETGKTGAHFWCSEQRGSLPEPGEMSALWATGGQSLFLGLMQQDYCMGVAGVIRSALETVVAFPASSPLVMSCKSVPNS